MEKIENVRYCVLECIHLPVIQMYIVLQCTYSRIPLVRSSSELIVHRTRKSSKLHPLNIHWAAKGVRSVSRSLPQLHQISSRNS